MRKSYKRFKLSAKKEKLASPCCFEVKKYLCLRLSSGPSLTAGCRPFGTLKHHRYEKVS